MPNLTAPGAEDVLSDVLRRVRLSGSLQFCFMPSGEWQTGAEPTMGTLAVGPAQVIPFHVLVEGNCWLRIGGDEVVLGEGDVVAFPFGIGHQLGAGRGGRLIEPTRDVPPKPWRALPLLRYGEDGPQVRLHCGYLECDAMSFRPLRKALPDLLIARTRTAPGADWLRATIRQIVAEVEVPRAGGLSVLERLTEITFIELLRHRLLSARPDAVGWLAALADPKLSRCLARIHEAPGHSWSVQALAQATGLSRSALGSRFEAVLGVSPMRYVRDWRLCLASTALRTGGKPIALVAQEAGYGTEAAFSRAFARAFGAPPAAWREGSLDLPAEPDGAGRPGGLGEGPLTGA